MKKYLLPDQGSYYKANLHCHSVYSDGAFTPEQLKERYKTHGYSVLAYTDHDVFIPHHDLTDDGFLALAGFEVECSEPLPIADRKTAHMCFIAKSPDVVIQPCWNEKYADKTHGEPYKHLVQFDPSQPPFERSHTPECVNAMIRAGREGGFFVTYNHPCWSQENYPDYSKYEGMHAMEICNFGCYELGFEDYVPYIYDEMLRGGERIYCIGADDNHSKSEIGISWIFVNADRLEYRTVTGALLDGNFYTSSGPEIYELNYEDGKIRIKTSPAEKIICSYDIRKAGGAVAKDGVPVTEAEFTKPDGVGYFRITVTDEKGRHACTNAYFFDEIEK